MKIKNNRKNVFYIIVGKLFIYILIYVGIIKLGLLLLEYIVNNCITTL